ncbi:vegetative cell wall protein gp1 [Iris pallida]|uniref:Vegetative cell wall protein gp1 n=1 Tax=Iris pallida TaxID=29817 RepID=A0AAX6HYI8_IRIPA|nr:vegetative cell wall protein gp1 [Iris pallida]
MVAADTEGTCRRGSRRTPRAASTRREEFFACPRRLGVEVGHCSGSSSLRRRDRAAHEGRCSARRWSRCTEERTGEYSRRSGSRGWRGAAWGCDTRRRRLNGWPGLGGGSSVTRGAAVVLAEMFAVGGSEINRRGDGDGWSRFSRERWMADLDGATSVEAKKGKSPTLSGPEGTGRT